MTSPVYVPKPKRPRRRSSLKRQRTALMIAAVVVAVLAVAFAIVHYFTSRTTFRDVDGTKYYVLAVDGVYVMQDADGNELPRTSDTSEYSVVYKTPLGTLVEVEPDTGKHTVVAIVATSGTEALQYSSYSDAYDILLYPMLERKDIHTIRVHNKNGEFAFLQRRNCTNTKCAYEDDCEKFTGSDRKCPKCGSASEMLEFVIENFPTTPFNSNMFATLVVVTGYTATYMRLDLDKVLEYAEAQYGKGEDESALINRFLLSEYGLASTLEEAENYFIISDIQGNTHKVIIGNEITAGSGYYARYVGRDEVYILKELEDTQYSTTLSAVAFAPIEDYVTPTVTDTMNSTDYFDVSDFKLNCVAPITEDMYKDPNLNVNTLLSNVITFSYSPIEKRQGSFYTNIPYTGGGAYVGFNLNSYRVDDCLQNIQTIAPLRTVKLLSEKENEQGVFYFLDFLDQQDLRIGYCMEYTHNTAREGAEKDYKVTESVYQQVWISTLTTSGTYYVYNAMFQMITEVSRSCFEYLEWDAFMWIEAEVFTGNIVYLDKMEITVPGGTTAGLTGLEHVVFDLNNSESLVGWDPTSTTIPTNKMMVSAAHSSKIEEVNLLQFKRFYQTLIYSSLSGTATCSEEQQQIFRDAAVSEGYTTADATPCLVIKVTFNTSPDGKGETIVRTYCFYSYGGGRQCFMSLNGNGSFYMLQTRVNKIISDIGRIFTPDVEIKPQDKN